MFENYTFEITTTSPRGQWVKVIPSFYHPMLRPHDKVLNALNCHVSIFCPVKHEKCLQCLQQWLMRTITLWSISSVLMPWLLVLLLVLAVGMKFTTGTETSARLFANASVNLARRVENRPGQVEFCIGYIRDYPVRGVPKNFSFPACTIQVSHFSCLPCG